MEIPDPVPEIVIAIPKRGKMRVTTVEEADALIAQACKAKAMILAAKAATDPADPAATAAGQAEAAPPERGAHPYPAGSLPVLSGRCAFGDHTACGIPGECDCPCRHDGEAEDAYVLTPAGEAAVDAPHPWYAGVDEEPCHGQRDDGAELWLCTAQAGHGGDEHVAYDADGEPLKTWPVRDAAHDTAGGTGPFAVPPGVDPMGPDAHKYHHPGCDCWDCRAYRSGETAEAARP